MKSIRLSLIIYFLALLAVALIAVGLFAYDTSARALKEKEQTNRKLLRTQFEERRREVNEKLDDKLLFDARAIANLAQSQFEAGRINYVQYLSVGMLLNAGPTPNSHVLAPLTLASQYNRGIRGFAIGSVGNEIQLREELLHGSEDYLAQVGSRRGRAWRSRTLGDRSLPAETERFQDMKMFDWKHDDIVFDGHALRRVMLKVPIVRVSFLPNPMPFFPRRPGDSSGGRRDRQPGPPPAPPTGPQITETIPIFIQCATDRTERDRSLIELETDLAEQLRTSDEGSRQSLTLLRNRLSWIAFLTFAGIAVGGSALIRYGLRPLNRLSDAVSRVSETDFRLRYEGPKPPAELVPIVERLTQTLAMLQRAFEREKQATADISHELRTPLAGLMTTLDVTLRKSRSPEEYREAMADCRDIVRQMTQLVERLLALTWLDARSDAVRREPVDVGELADQCAAVIRPLAKAHGLTLRVEKDAPVKVQTDPDKLREVVSNLLHNAVEYNRPEGAIDLRVRSSAKGIDVEVRDTGIGISPEHRERIFERFFRADESRHAAGMHAGLGLAIVRGYVELMGGTIRVDSELGQGSTFHVHVPAGVK